jgi:hypothetical protein
LKIEASKEAVRPAETVTDLEELTNIMQYDIEAAERTPSKEVVYVKRDEPRVRDTKVEKPGRNSVTRRHVSLSA